MPRFAANLSMMFNEWDFLDRFDAAAAAGFEAVEFLFPYEVPAEAIGERLRRNNLTQALFNLWPGDYAGGERGLAALDGRVDELKQGIERAVPYIDATGVQRVHLMAGLASPRDPGALARYRSAVTYAADRLAPLGVTVMLEPINTRGMPGYFLDSFDLAERVIADLGKPNVALQFDVFHRQIMHGDVTMALRRLLPITQHIQIASVPSRNEPDGEELNYPFLFEELDRLGYAGFVGCEYRPRGRTLDGLGWFTPYAGR
jgi:hydroxypyruvate isomerase